ncbi:MAG: S8 family serine peptidase [Candidatus Moranbacteria bacterium]|nr:S8 family serine peptidase [Candidatus Moranbacteria bacterium]
MKQKHKIIYILFTAIVVLTLVFPMGNFFYSPQSNAAAKNNIEKNYIESEVVAKMAPEADADALAAKYSLTVELLKTSLDGNLYILKSKNNLSTKKIIAVLEKDPAIISVQPNFKYKLLSRIPNDQYFSQEWPLADTTSTAGGVSAPSAWDLETKSKNQISIAVIDTGVSDKNPEISGSLTSGRMKGINVNSPKKKPTDSDGHGTFVAGIIAAQTNNKKGLAGASFFNNLKIMPLKFDFTTDQAISAVSYAKARHIPIINASWGAYGEEGLDLLLKDSIAAYPGVFVTAAGNGDPKTFIGYNHDGGDPNKKMYPCDFDLANIVCVGATGKDGALAEYSDYGATSVDVAAPGGTDDDPIIGLDLKKNKYTEEEGSSLSTAFVSAEAGLILSKKPNLSASQIIGIIKSSVDPEASLAGKTVTGGKINFQKALQTAASY